MTIVLVTGMSGTGKSTVLAELHRRGHQVVDTDDGDWSFTAPDPQTGLPEQLWREDRIEALLAEHREGTLYVQGCVSNQGGFYKYFDAVVVLTAPVEVILERIATRTTNPFGKSADERTRIRRDVETVEPLLRASATAEIDATAPVEAIADELERYQHDLR
jgi:dephospho-CoA kinase